MDVDMTSSHGHGLARWCKLLVLLAEVVSRLSVKDGGRVRSLMLHVFQHQGMDSPLLLQTDRHQILALQISDFRLNHVAGAACFA